MKAECTKKVNLVKLMCTFWGKQRYKCYSHSTSVLKNINILPALIDKINSPKTKRLPALTLPFKASYTEMQIYLTTPSVLTHSQHVKLFC